MKTKVVLASFCVVSAASMSFGLLSKTGKAGYTGSPGEQACTNCHNSYAINSGGGNIHLVTNFHNDHYYPDSTYQISVVVGKTGVNLFGFGFEALNSSSSSVGTFTVTDGVHTQQLTAANGRKNMTHKLNGGAFPDSAVFTFKWKAPATPPGDITFYYTGVCGNGNNQDNLDYVYKGTHVITPSPTLAVQDETQEVSHLLVKPYPGGQTVDVSLYLNQTSEVKMDITTMDGKVVGSQTHSMQDAGEQSYTFSTDQLNGGVYILQALVNGKGFSKKFFLVK